MGDGSALSLAAAEKHDDLLSRRTLVRIVTDVKKTQKLLRAEVHTHVMHYSSLV